MKCFKLRERAGGRGPKYIMELYEFHPENGPIGTMGTGPYCVGNVDIPASRADEAVARAIEQGLTQVDDAQAAHAKA
jgi:hypothetical protein